MPSSNPLRTAALVASLVALGPAASAPRARTQAQPPATPEEEVGKVRQAAQLLARKGAAGLDRLRRPGPPYVWKNSYVFVLDCEAGTTAAHPLRPEMHGRPFAAIPTYGGQAPEGFAAELCDAGRRSGGGWVAYPFPKPGERQPSRKVSYELAVAGFAAAVLPGLSPIGSLTDEDPSRCYRARKRQQVPLPHPFPHFRVFGRRGK